jgi:hypothetical protein
VTASEILRRGRHLIRQGWCQRADARDAGGKEVLPWSDAARSWSILGSVVGSDGVARGAFGAMPIVELGEAIVALGEAAGTDSLEAWNDDPGRTQDDVVALFDHALELLPARAQARVDDLRAVE